jgi:hypothetical protein
MSSTKATSPSIFDSVENEDLLKEAGSSNATFIPNTFWENNSIFKEDINTAEAEDTTNQVTEEVKPSIFDKTEEVITKDPIIQSDNTTEEDNKETKEEISSWNLIVNNLIDNGVISEIPEGIELDDNLEGLSKLIETDKNKYAKTYFETELAKLNPELKKIVDYELQGINSSELMEDFIDFKNVDTTDEDSVKELLKMYLVAQGEDEAEINIEDEYLSLSTTPSLLEKQVNRAVKFLSDKQENEINEKSKILQERQKLEKEREELENQKKYEGFKQKVTSIKTLKGLSINQEEANQLFDYMTKPVKNGKTQAELAQTDEDLFLLEYIKMKGIDLGALARKANTEATKQTKKILTRQSLEDKGITIKREDNINTGQDLSWLKGFKIV